MESIVISAIVAGSFGLHLLASSFRGFCFGRRSLDHIIVPVVIVSGLFLG
jgi:hypothetical protein